MATVLEFRRPAAPAPTVTKTSAETFTKKRVWHHPTKEYVRAEAASDEAQEGAPNVYTDYLKLYGRYPSPQQAAAMGLRLGRRLRADDGKFYPPKTAAEKKHDRERRARQREFARVHDAALNVLYAVNWLATLQASDAEILAYLADDQAFGDAAAIARDLPVALQRLKDLAMALAAVP